MLELMRGKWSLWVALTLNLALGACSGASKGGEQTVEGCIAQYAPDKGYDFASEAPICAAPPPPAPMPVCPAITPQSISEQCAAAGAPCDPNRFITRDAAMCIARLQGLSEGLSPWTAKLVFRADSKRPFWIISNVTMKDPGNCSSGGDDARIDAISGAVAEMGSWDSIC
jgi:hypothetical protein